MTTYAQVESEYEKFIKEQQDAMNSMNNNDSLLLIELEKQFLVNDASEILEDSLMEEETTEEVVTEIEE